jgi:NADPH2 dehydrogenase
MQDPIPTYTSLLTSLRDTHPNLAYISLIEPWVYGNTDNGDTFIGSNVPLYKIWAPRPILAGGYTSQIPKAFKDAEEHNIIAVFGRDFISNVSERFYLPIGLVDKTNANTLVFT